MKYTIRKGDTLSDLAARYPDADVDWKALWIRNRDVVGKDPDLIKPGQVLDLPFNFRTWVRNLIKAKA